MSLTTTNEPIIRRPRARLVFAGGATAGLTIALIGAGAFGAYAAPYGGTAPSTGITVTGDGVSGNASAGYTVDLSENGSASATSGVLEITVTGTGLQADSQAFPAFGQVYYQAGDTVPTYTGIYASVGRADGLPVSDSAAASERSAAQTWWVHEGTQDRVQPGAEAEWTDFASGSFTVSYEVPWTYDEDTETYTLGTSTEATDGDNVFQVYTQNGIGASDIDNERAVDLTLVG